MIGIILLAASAFWFRGFVQSGRFEQYLDGHPNPQVNSQVEYYWGITLALAGHRDSARYRFKRVCTNYPDAEYAPLAWAELITMDYEENARSAVIDEGGKFLKKYPAHPKAEMIRKKVTFLQYGA
ncbi:MAG: tetratricopeptide repeat protein [Endomicrobiales bacterium]